MLTVTTPAASFRLTTVDAVKTELGITNAADDAWIETAIDRGSAEIASHCRRVFAREAATEIFRGLPQCRAPGHPPAPIILSRAPVVSVASVTADGASLAADQYEVEAGSGLLYRLVNDERVSWGSRKVVVAYTAGWVVPGQAATGFARNLPHDVEAACISLIKGRWFAKGRDPLVKSVDVDGVASEQYWVGGFAEDGSLPPDVESMLAQFVNWAA